MLSLSGSAMPPNQRSQTKAPGGFLPHPLDQLTIEEIGKARNIILGRHSATSIGFRTITLEEPSKKILTMFLSAEHKGELSSVTWRPPRRARILFELISKDGSVELCESVVDVGTGLEKSFTVLDKKCHAPLNAYVIPLLKHRIKLNYSSEEVAMFPEVTMESPLFKKLLQSFHCHLTLSS